MSVEFSILTTPHRFRETTSARRGMALAIVVWVVATLSVLVMGWSRAAGQQARHGAHLLATQIERDLVLGALRAATDVLRVDADRSADALHEAWARRQEVSIGPLGGMGTVRCRWTITDEQARLNLNVAAPEALIRLPGWDRRMAERLMAWRGDASLDPWLLEEEERFYAWRAASGRAPARRCKRAPLESVEELLLVHGMTPEQWRAIEPLVTVFGDGAVNINTAPPQVLELVGVAGDVAAWIARHLAGADGALGTDDDQAIRGAGDLAQVSGLSPAEIADLMRLFHRRVLSGQTSAFRIMLEGRVEGSSTGRRAIAIVTRIGNRARCEAFRYE